jgi:proteasome alpha subunit
VSMPFYVSPEQQMRDKSDYARKGVARSRSSVVLQYAGGILMVTPNVSSVLHKISEIYDRIAFAAVGRSNEYEVLRKAGVTYADVTGYQFDRGDVTAHGLANWYAQALSATFTESMKPYEVEIVVAEVGARPDADQIYRITWDGSVSDEPGYVAFGGQADQVAAVLKERFSDNMSLTEALAAALAALTAPPPTPPAASSTSASASGYASARSASASASSAASTANSTPTELTAAQLEVAILDRARAHRTFRRLSGPRLEELIAESRAAAATAESESAAEPESETPAETATETKAPVEAETPAEEPPTGPAAGGDGIPKPPTAK